MRRGKARDDGLVVIDPAQTVARFDDTLLWGGGRRRKRMGNWGEAVWWRKDLHSWRPNLPYP